jgi:4-hydroxy-3-polyprenylbenzoate decarboxylase
MTMVPEIVDMDMPVEGVFHNLVITQIQKDYAGQGQKVMNAMWGAGQMMFNKILVLADTGVQIQDYGALARYVFKNLDVANDVVFSTGPMDVLDHSCSKMGFGGKMCIDGTRKLAEESEDQNHISVNLLERLPLAADFSSYTEISGVNISLAEQGIPCLVIAVAKNRIGHIRALHKAICTEIPAMERIKMVLYVENTVDPQHLPIALWRFCNNLDPKRDHFLFTKPSSLEDGKHFNCLGLDGTIKTKEFDNFQRDWPNIIVASDATIEAVDQKWNQLGLGDFIPSPSRLFKHQVYGNEAVAQ